MSEVGKEKVAPTGVDALIEAVTAAVVNDTGKSATLRRLDPEDSVGAPALHAILAQAGVHPNELHDEGIDRYATCVRLIALLARVEGEAVSPGKGFAELELSEQRLARLQASSDDGLRDLVTSIVRRAVSARVKIRPKQLCQMVLGDVPEPADGDRANWDRVRIMREQAESARSRILQDYYRAVDAKAAAA